MKTAVLLTGRITDVKFAENHFSQIITPYNADIFIDSWIPFRKNTMAIGPYRLEEIVESLTLNQETPSNVFDQLVANGMPAEAALKWVEGIFAEDPPVDLVEFANVYQPKFLHLENFDLVPLIYQVRALKRAKGNTISKKAIDGIESFGTKIENVIFMWYKIWRTNELRKMYEKSHRVRYDRIIRMRLDSTFEGMPIIEPVPKTVYVPVGVDYHGGLFDQFAMGDAQTMDLYCDLYNEIYRYIVSGMGMHPESLLRKHLEVNRLNLIRFNCKVFLRGEPLIPDQVIL